MEKLWKGLRVKGRDEFLRTIERQANTYRANIVQAFRDMMNDYEVDIYRIIIAIGRIYGMETAYEIMRETVTEKRIKWLNERLEKLGLSGTDLEKGLDLFINYFNPKEGEFEIIERSTHRVVFRRKEYVNAVSYACEVLGLDLIEVQNKVYAKATNSMLERFNPHLIYVVLNCDKGWYKEMIELDFGKIT